MRVDEYICKEWYQRWIEYSAIIQIRKRFVLQCVCVRRFMMRPISSSTFLFLTFLLVNLSGTRGAGFTQDWIRGSSNIVKCQPSCHCGGRTLGTFSLLRKSLFVWSLPKWKTPPAALRAIWAAAPISNCSGESDEGAHPHDGLELEDGKGFVAVGPADF